MIHLVTVNQKKTMHPPKPYFHDIKKNLGSRIEERGSDCPYDQ
jgi:hypothetical protein